MDVNNNIAFPVTNTNLPISIKGLGINYIQNGIDRPIGYEDYQWIQTRAGYGYVHIYDKKYKISEGQGFLLPPNIKHSYFPGKEGWIQDWIAFNGEGVLAYYSDLKLLQFEIIKASSNVPILIKKAFKEYERRAFSMMSAIIIQILYEVSATKNIEDNILKPVLDYISNNYNKDISIDDMAKILNYTPQYFCKIFLKIMKLRPFLYLAMIRIAKSKEILVNNPLMYLDEVAKLVGFSSVSYFCKTFRKLENISPTEFI
jgi:AraC-like DNA-binding protein